MSLVRLFTTGAGSPRKLATSLSSSPGSRVVVQTYSPGHYAVEFASRHDYDGFARKELGLRRELHYPPFGRLAYVGVAGVELSAVTAAAQSIAATLRADAPGIETLGPAPDPLPKARGEYRLRLALKSESEDVLLETAGRVQALRRSSDVRLTVTVDPR